MAFLSKHYDAIMHLAASLLLSSFLIDNDKVKGIGFVCSALLAALSVGVFLYNLIKNKNSDLLLSLESKWYWIGLFFIAATLLYNEGDQIIALVLILLCVVYSLTLMLFKKQQRA